MKTISKYELSDGTTQIEMPEFSKILSVQIDQQINVAYVLALVDTSQKIETRTFQFFSTRQEIGFLYHFFEVEKNDG